MAAGVLQLCIDPASSEVYQYVDRHGVISLTNVPTDTRYKRIDLTALPTSHAPIPVKDLDHAITRSARLHRLHPALVRAIIKAESDFDPRAVSRAGALGLMQLMPDTAVQHNVRDAFDPEENIAGGTKHLRYLLDRFHGNLPLALAAYNAGEHTVDRYQSLPPIDETRRYVQKVLRYYRRFLLAPSSIHPTP
jgi:soluble lytic murein transglycosylase